MYFYLRHGHSDYHTSSGGSKVLGSPNIRLDMTSILLFYYLAKLYYTSLFMV